MSIRLSKVETPGEHSKLSQWSGWGSDLTGMDSRRGEELETMSKQNLEEFFVKRGNIVGTRGDRESFTLNT